MPVDHKPVCLITGASGFLGANLALAAAARWEVVGTGRSEHSRLDNYHPCELTDRAALDQLFQQVRPDIVISAAALADHGKCESQPDLAFSINAVVPAEIAQRCTEIGARLIHISTDAVFDGTRGGYTETDSTNPTSRYGETKLAGEQCVLAAAPDALIARTNFFGWSPTGTRSILEFFLRNLLARTPVTGFSDYFVSSIYVQDLCESLINLGQAQADGILNLAASDAISKYDFGCLVATQWGIDPSLVAEGSASVLDQDGTRGRNLSLDVTRAQQLLGYSLPSQADGIRQAHADFYRLVRKLALDSNDWRL